MRIKYESNVFDNWMIVCLLHHFGKFLTSEKHNSYHGHGDEILIFNESEVCDHQSDRKN